jgi:hypothetical protein
MNFSRVVNKSLQGVNMKPGYQFGVGIEYYFTNHWGIQPSLMLISKGYKNEGSYSSDPTSYGSEMIPFKGVENRVYIELPVMLAYRLNLSGAMKLIFNGGGYISYGIDGQNKYTETHEDGYSIWHNVTFSRIGLKRFDTGLTAGATFELKHRYTIGLFGEWGLYDPSYHQFKKTYGLKNQTYGLNVGYKF